MPLATVPWTAWAFAFVLTLVVEVPVYVLVLAPKQAQAGGRSRVVPGVAVLVNMATHPAFWWTTLAVATTPARWLVAVTVGEVLVWTVEWLLVWRLAGGLPGRSAFAAAGANVASLTVGLLAAVGRA